MEMKKLTYNVTEVAAMLGVGKSLVYEMVAQKRIPSIRIGEKRVVIPADEFNNWFRRQVEEGLQ